MEGAHGWWSSPPKWVVDGFAETAQFLSELASAKVRDLPEALQGDAARAWHKRWSSILSCAAAKSFALSLQDRAPTGVDGHTPSVHEVIRDDRFS